jgi:isopentenyl-diphosphate Delta-isomerase
MTDISQRKSDHLNIVLSGVAAHGRDAGFDVIRFAHNAMPEINLASIDLSTRFLGKNLKLPYLASSMTGGPERAEAINRAIAEAAQELGFAMGVGSQRIALATGLNSGLSAVLRKVAPTIPLYANLGAVQFVTGLGVDDARRAIDAIEADALILHFNPLQEALQDGGDVDWLGVEIAVAELARALPVPVIAKEVGAGISAAVAQRLFNCGVAAIDVAGAGGTSWAAVEGARSEAGPELGEIFRDWGIPTPHCLADIHAALPHLPLIASGGIRHGLDGAKAIRLGAGLVGQAAPLLKAAVEGTEAVIRHVQDFAKAVAIACFVTGSEDLAALRKAPLMAASGERGLPDRQLF